MRTPRISIVIPAYNEEKRIGRTLKYYKEFFDDLYKRKIIDYKILVVINNTNDRTEEIVKKFAGKKVAYLNLKEGGKGLAITAGFKEELKENKSDLIGFVDADMSTSPEAFFDLVKNLGRYDGIIASRYVKGAKVSPKPSLARIIVSRIFNLLFRALFLSSYKDTQCGAKIFKKNVVEKVTPELEITQWAFDIDLVYKIEKNGFRLKEHPTVWADEKYSRINFMKAGPRMALAIIRLRLINSKLSFLARAYDDLLPNKVKLYLK